jgi:hypothetical protein
VRTFAQSITLNAPEVLDQGQTVELSGSIVQPEGVATGTRVAPLRYPMSVHWSGSSNLAIGSGDTAVAAARRSGKVAILDPPTRKLTALGRGSVTASVTNDSMRPYTDEASLAPITTSKTIQVRPLAPAGPAFSATIPVFTTQPVGTFGQVRDVEVTNTGDQALRINSMTVQSTSPAGWAPFRIDRDRCDGRTIVPGGASTVSVRFTPTQPYVTYAASPVFQTNTAGHRESVALTGTSTTLYRSVWPLAE